MTTEASTTLSGVLQGSLISRSLRRCQSDTMAPWQYLQLINSIINSSSHGCTKVHLTQLSHAALSIEESLNEWDFDKCTATIAILTAGDQNKYNTDLDLILGHTNHQCQLHAFLLAWVIALIKMSLEENLLFLGIYSAFFSLLPWSFRVNLLVTTFI